MDKSEQEASPDESERIEEEIYFDDDDALDERTIRSEKSRIMREINRNKQNKHINKNNNLRH